MNSVIETIKSRRTVRKYKPDQIKEEELQAILDAAKYAPSAHNDQSWHFTVVQDRAVMDELGKACKLATQKKTTDELLKKIVFNEELDIFYGAPTIVVVSGEEKAMMPAIDCAAATQNMLLAAESLGIGSCWNGIAAFLFMGEGWEEYAQRLRIPEGYRPYYAVALGYKASKPQKALPRREGTINFIR